MTKPTPPAPVRQTFDLPDGRSVEYSFTAPDLIASEVKPNMMFADRPEAVRFLEAYVAARRQFMQTVSTLTGLTLQIVDELPDDLQAISEPIAPRRDQ